MKTKLFLIFVLLSVTFINAQDQKELADKYLSKRGELAFTFTANNFDEINQLSRIISFDHHQDSNPLTINAIANNKGFEKFLTYNLSFEINIKANEPKNVVMYDKNIHGKGVSGKNTALTFPLEAYPNYADYVQQMNDFVTNNPTIARLEVIGTTSGTGSGLPTYTGGSHQILAIVLSDNVNSDEAEPRLLYTSSIHGDELAGYPSMLNLINHLIEGYKGNHADNDDNINAQNLINGAEIWINPLANPDGTFRTTNADVSSSIRGNANIIDMNRNYPAPDGTLHPDGESYQYETTQFMTLGDTYHFVLAANFHGGEEVFNYPWDFTYDRTVDDDWWRFVGEEYALNAQNDSPIGYSDPNDNPIGGNDGTEYFDFLKSTIYESNPILGVTHGADWYRIDGGRQDYMNFEQQCREVTIELSQTKTSPSPASGSINYDILDLWNYNKNAYIDFLLQGTFGFRGIVIDNITTNPIKAKITIVGRDDQALSRNSWVETELPFGDFYRLIEAGTYDILIEADCYQSKTLSSQAITNGVVNDLGTISLIPLSAVIPTNLAASSITTTTATIGWDDIGVTSYDVQYGIQGTLTSTWTTVSSLTNSLALTSLVANTTYEFQVRSVCNASTSSYSASTLFTTLSASYCTSEGTNITQEYISNVQLESINNTSGGVGYSDFTSISTDLLTGSNFTITISKFGNKGDAFAVWIDYNKDGDFLDSGEQVASSTSVLTGSFSVPLTAFIGSTRMRVSLKRSTIPTSCETFTRGEVEDYTVNIIDSTLGIQDELLSEFVLYPNPVNNDEIKLRMPKEITDFNVTISNVLGQKVYQKEVISNYNNLHKVNTSNLKSGIYFVTVSTNLGMATKKMIIQ